MGDLDELMRSGDRGPIPEPRSPRLWPFVWVALALVTVSASIALFWPAPPHHLSLREWIFPSHAQSEG